MPANVSSVSAQPWESQRPGRKHLAVLAALVAVLGLCFIVPLTQWMGFSIDSEFYSYMPLIPGITGYLIWIRRQELNAAARPSWGLALAAIAAGGIVLGLYLLATNRGWTATEQDYLSIMMFAFVLMLAGLGYAVLGAPTMRAVGFPVAMLIFMVPYPEAVNDWLVSFFQVTSAIAAHAMYAIVGTSCTRVGIVLNLPTDFGLSVDPECSGIHSTQVLLITSLLAGNLFLTASWRRIVLALFVVPLAIVRNGFRIFVIGELCVHIDHKMIDSWIHRHGGPVFFALSLIPFFFFLVWLRKGELKAVRAVKTSNGAAPKHN